MNELILAALVRIVFLLLCCVCFWLPAYNQQARQYSFTHFTIANTLASNYVQAITQDKDGYIWLATLNGLQRYDGHSFITFRNQSGSPHSVPTDNIGTIFADSKNNLWIAGENNKVGIFNPHTFRFRNIPIAGLPQRKVYSQQYFFEAPDGSVFLHVKGHELYRLDVKARQFKRADNVIPFPQGWSIRNIAWDNVSRRYWMAADSGIVVYNPATRQLNYRGHNVENDPAIAVCSEIRWVFNIGTDAAGNICFGTWHPREVVPYVHKFDRGAARHERFQLISELNLGYHEPNGFLLQKNGRFWAYGNAFFAEWTARYPHPFAAIPVGVEGGNSMKFDRIQSTFEDREGNIWIASDNGAYLFNPAEQVFSSFNLIKPGSDKSYEAAVNAVLETPDGRIFVGSWDTDLVAFDKNFNPLPLPPGLRSVSTSSIWDMTLHSKTGQLWIAFQAGKVVVYDLYQDRAVALSPEAFGGRTIRQVTEDADGNLWFGTQGGRIVKWDYKISGGDPYIGYRTIGETSLIHKLHSDGKGHIWVSTFGDGVQKYDIRTNKLLRTFTSGGKEGERLFSNSATDITGYNDSTLIIAAGCINVLNTNTSKITFISSENGLPSNYLMSVQCDPRGTVWAGSLNGLSRINIEKKVVSNYDRRDGIVYDKFGIAGVEELSDGRIVFFTDHNFLVLDPNRFIQTNNPPQPYITSFKLSGQQLLVDSLMNAGEAILKYNNTSIAIGFSSLSYIKQRKLHYYYMLEGVDKDWLHAEHPGEVIYNFLPPGSYVFKVRSENADGVVSQQMAVLEVTVRAPIWRSWWFYAAIGLLVAGVFFWIDRERINRLRALRRMRAEIRGNLHQEINTTLNNINILSEMAKMKAEKDPGRSREYIEQISEKSHNMIIMMDDILWGIDPRNDNMEETLMRLKEFIEALQNRHKALVSLAVDKPVLDLELDMKTRQELFLIMKLALRMLVEDASGKATQINLDKVRSRLILKLQDGTVESITSQASYARHLEELQSRAASINAEVDVQHDRKGLSVIVILPL